MPRPAGWPMYAGPCLRPWKSKAMRSSSSPRVIRASNIKVPTPVVRIGENVRVCFVEHHHYFGREGLYGEAGGEYQDNLERFAYFCHESFQILKEIKFSPDIIHCHDWHTALIPVLLKTNYQNDPFFKNTRSVLTIHNLAYQGVFPKNQYGKLGINGHVFHTPGPGIL